MEMVVLLSQQKPEDRIEVEIDLDELDLTSAESKGNLLKSEGARGPVYLCSARTGAAAETVRQPQCPEEKEKAIMDALEHFGMI